MTAPGDATRHRLGAGSFASAGQAWSQQIRRDVGTGTLTIKLLAQVQHERRHHGLALEHYRLRPIDNAPTRREHPGEAMLGPFGSIPG